MRLLFTFLFSLLFIVSGRAQERVRNVRIRVIDSSQLEIRYDLINVRPNDSIYLAIESRLRGELYILPEFVRGDLGTRVMAGSDRRVIWEALANGYSLNEDIRATVLVKAGLPTTPGQPLSSNPAATRKPAITPEKPAPTEPVTVTEPKPKNPETPVVSTPVSPQPDQQTKPMQPAETNRATVPTDAERSRKTRYVGPAWALLSAVAPGMGNIFVQTPKPKIGFRPLALIGSYGLLVYGLMEQQKSRDVYAIYEQQKNMTAAEPYYKTANSHHQNYYFATRGAAIVAAVDVVLTFIKGMRNNRLQKTSRLIQPVSVRPGIQAGQPTAVVHFSF